MTNFLNYFIVKLPVWANKYPFDEPLTVDARNFHYYNYNNYLL